MMRACALSRVYYGALLVVSCTAPGNPLRAQSLADLARIEAERRSGIAQPSRIYTNKDLKPVRSPERSLPADESATALRPRPQEADDTERSSSAATPV